MVAVREVVRIYSYLYDRAGNSASQYRLAIARHKKGLDEARDSGMEACLLESARRRAFLPF